MSTLALAPCPSRTGPCLPGLTTLPSALTHGPSPRASSSSSLLPGRAPSAARSLQSCPNKRASPTACRPCPYPLLLAQEGLSVPCCPSGLHTRAQHVAGALEVPREGRHLLAALFWVLAFRVGLSLSPG